PDLVDYDIITLVRIEIEELVSGSFLAGKPIVPVSSVTGAGLDALRAAILKSVAEVDDRDATTRVFRLPIDRVFTMKGFGPVITGTTYAGRLNVDTEVEVLPSGNRARLPSRRCGWSRRWSPWAAIVSSSAAIRRPSPSAAG